MSRAKPIPWFSTSPSFYNDTEVLFVAFLVKMSGYAEPKELLEWAAAAVLQTERVKELGVLWTPPDDPAWKARGTTDIPYMVAVLEHAVTRTWTGAELEQIGKAMKVGHSEATPP